MDIEKVIKGLELTLEGLKAGTGVSVTLPKQDMSTQDLAEKVAEAYKTFHPEYGVETLYKDIKNLARNNDKFGYLIGWLRQKGSTGLDTLFASSREEQQKKLIEAIDNNEALIKQILTKRYAQ